MSNLDTVILIVGSVFVLLGIYWGLIRQVLALIGLLVGVAMAGRYGPDVAAWLSSFISDPSVAGAVGFIAVLLLVSALASLIASLLRIFIGLLFLGWLDHLLGGLLGLAQAVLALAALMVGLVTFPVPSWTSALQDSRFAEPLLRVGGVLTTMLPEMFSTAVRTALGG